MDWVTVLEYLIEGDDWDLLQDDLWAGSLWIRARRDGSFELAVFPELNWFQRLSLRLGDWEFLYDWRDLGYLAYECHSYSEFLEVVANRIEKFLGN